MTAAKAGEDVAEFQPEAAAVDDCRGLAGVEIEDHLGGAVPVAGAGESPAAVTGPTTKTQRESLDGVEGRAPAPDVAGTTLAGESISLAELRGGDRPGSPADRGLFDRLRGVFGG